MKKLLFVALLLPLFTNAQTIKNVDIKNGFLQFHLGDNLSKYNDEIYVATDKHPDHNEVRPKALGLMSKYLDRVVLVNEKGIVTEIDVFIHDEASIQYIDRMINIAYGPQPEAVNTDKYQEGTHLTYTTWAGQRATIIMLQNNINRTVNGHMTRGRIQSLVFKKTGDVAVDGVLPDGFAL